MCNRKAHALDILIFNQAGVPTRIKKNTRKLFVANYISNNVNEKITRYEQHPPYFNHFLLLKK